MARATFAGTAGDFLATISNGGLIRAIPGSLTIWSAKTGGTQLTDLLLDGSPVSSIPVGADGQVPQFQGPDGVSDVWADAGGGSRVRLVPDIVGVLTGEDAAVSALVNSTTSDTRTALNGLIATESTSVVQTLVPGEVADAVAGHTPGSEMGYAERTSNFTTTAVTPSLALIPALSVVVTGTGRPVDVEAVLPRVSHSVADGGCIAGIWGVKTGSEGAYVQLSEMKTPTTATYGEEMRLSRRLVLPAGEEWTFAVYIAGLVAGTTTVTAAPGSFSVIPSISVISR